MIQLGETEIGGRLPVNTDGGCLANGEPIGASGLRQVYESVLQLRGEAGARQVPGRAPDGVHPRVRRAGDQRLHGPVDLIPHGGAATTLAIVLVSRSGAGTCDPMTRTVERGAPRPCRQGRGELATSTSSCVGLVRSSSVIEVS